MTTAPSRPALRYFGGKWRLAPWLISQFPAHECYVEPYGGGASVLLQKPPAAIETYNDIWREVVTFFRVLRERPADLIAAIEMTPFSRVELDEALETQPGDELTDLERARRFYVCSWQARGGPRAAWRSGWRYERTDSRGKRALDDFNQTDHLWAVVTRLKHVQIECDDALRVIDRFDTPDTLFYCDPPYVHSTRGKWGDRAYHGEMSDGDHRRLAEILHRIQGMALISGYPSALYDELYADWARSETQARTGGIANGAVLATEMLWISPRAAAGHAQMRMFEGVA